MQEQGLYIYKVALNVNIIHVMRRHARYVLKPIEDAIALCNFIRIRGIPIGEIFDWMGLSLRRRGTMVEE